MHIYMADPAIRGEQIEAIRERLPEGWALTDTPAGAAAILSENVEVTQAMIDAAGEGLRLIALLDTGGATVTGETSAAVVSLPNTALTGVAEHTVFLIMALRRHFLWVNEQTRNQQWLPDRSEPILTDQRKYTYNWIGLADFGTLYRKTVGLIGLGLIGRAVAERLRGFGVRILYHQRTPLSPQEEARLGVAYRSLDDLLRESDVVSLHHRFQEGDGAGNGGNDKHIGSRELALMKPTAILINTARGRLVDEDALYAALRDGVIAGAALDVFRYEPLPPDHPFFTLPPDKLIMTPHVAGAPVVEAWGTVAEELIERMKNEE